VYISLSFGWGTTNPNMVDNDNSENHKHHTQCTTETFLCSQSSEDATS
jgi:hypothetical protein